MYFIDSLILIDHPKSNGLSDLIHPGLNFHNSESPSKISGGIKLGNLNGSGMLEGSITPGGSNHFSGT
jgi:hypothetical protein